MLFVDETNLPVSEGSPKPDALFGLQLHDEALWWKKWHVTK